MRCAAAQLPACTGDAKADVAVAEAAVRCAAAGGADLVVLPELATLPYISGEQRPGRTEIGLSRFPAR